MDPAGIENLFLKVKEGLFSLRRGAWRTLRTFPDIEMMAGDLALLEAISGETVETVAGLKRALGGFRPILKGIDAARRGIPLSGLTLSAGILSLLFAEVVEFFESPHNFRERKAGLFQKIGERGGFDGSPVLLLAGPSSSMKPAVLERLLDGGALLIYAGDEKGNSLFERGVKERGTFLRAGRGMTSLTIPLGIFLEHIISTEGLRAQDTKILFEAVEKRIFCVIIDLTGGEPENMAVLAGAMNFGFAPVSVSIDIPAILPLFPRW